MIYSLSRSVIDLWQRRTIVGEEQKRFAVAQKRHEELTKKLEMVQTPAFVEQEARDRLGLAKEGDTILFIDNSPDKNDTTSVVSDSPLEGDRHQLPNWKRWWQVFF